MDHSFQFKLFSIRHDRCVHKVGTDGVLLGAWTSPVDVKTILDIGTGSGLIALILAQRTDQEVTIDAVEPDEASFLQAQENASHSPWHERIKIFHTSIQQYSTIKSYDLIVSNPPFFNDSLVPPSAGRQMARHTTSLSYADLLKAATQLLSSSGKLSVILPTLEGNHFQSLAREAGLHCSRQLAFFSRKEKPQERWLMEFVRQPVKMISEVLVLYDGDEWSEEYKALTGSFYL